MQDDLDSELDDASSEDEQQAAEPEDAGEQLLQKQEKQSARASKRKAQEAFAKPKPTQRAVASSSKVQKAAKSDKKIRRDRTLQVQRQSSRAHAREIAGAVEQRLKDEALKKVCGTDQCILNVNVHSLPRSKLPEQKIGL